MGKEFLKLAVIIIGGALVNKYLWATIIPASVTSTTTTSTTTSH